MPIYEYQGQRYDLKDGLSPTEAKTKIQSFLDKDKEEEKDPNFFTSFFAGVASGALKIPEGFVSLGAELVDLGLDTDTAASVDEFFDTINPFEEIAEKSLTGKITEGLIQLGIPGVAGYRIGSQLARKGIKAKRAGTYADKNFIGPIAKGQRRVPARKGEDFSRFSLRDDLLDKLKVGGSGLLGSTVGETIAFDESLGTIGDVIGGPTVTDRTEGLGGRDEAYRRFTNRFKFGVESGVIGGALGATVTGVGKAIKASPIARQLDKSPIQSKIGKIVNSLSSQGALGGKFFEIWKDGSSALAAFGKNSEQIIGDLGNTTEQLAKDIVKQNGGEKKEVVTKLTKLINNRFSNFGEFDTKKFIAGKEIKKTPDPRTIYRTPEFNTVKLPDGTIKKTPNQAFKARKELNNYLKDNLKYSDAQINSFDEKILRARFQVDQNSIDLTENLIKPLKEQIKEFKIQNVGEISDDILKLEKNLLNLDETLTSNLGKYVNREYQLFKTGSKNPLSAIFKNSEFKPAAEVIARSQEVFRRAFEQAFRNSPDTLDTAIKTVENKLKKQNFIKENKGLRAREVDRAYNIAKQKEIDKEVYRLTNDFYFNKSESLAEKAVDNILRSRGATLQESDVIDGALKAALRSNKNKTFDRLTEHLDIDEAILTKRTINSPVIRELLGEIDDPFYNIANTLSKQEELITQLRTHENLFAASNKVIPGTGGATKNTMFFNNREEAMDMLERQSRIDPKMKDIAYGPDDIVQIKTTAGAGQQELPSILNGKYALRGVADALESTNRALSQGALTNLYKWMVLVPKSISQQAKTIYSPFTHVRNIISATLFTTMNGNILFQDPRRTMKYFSRALKDITGKDQVSQIRQLRNQRLGINGTSAVAGDIDALAKEVGTDIYNSNFNGFMDKLLNRAAKLSKGARNAYLAEDNLWKNFNFEVELDQMKDSFIKMGIDEKNIFDPKNLSAYSKLLGRKVKPDDPIFKRVVDISTDGKYLTMGNGPRLTGPQLLETFQENMAAHITKNNIPNYEYVGEFIKTLRRLPLGTFIAFPAEILRTGYNTIQRGLREIQVPAFRQTGMKRLAGVATTAAIVPAGLVTMGKGLANMNDDDKKALRKFVPSWSQNGLLMPISRDEETGKVKYVDLSYIFPYDTLIRPVTTVLNEASKGEQTGESLNKYLLDAGIASMYELSKPFVSESIFFEAFADIVLRNGRSRSGRQVFREGDSVGEKLQKGTMHIIETFEPGSVNAIGRLFDSIGEKTPDRYGQTFDLGDEAAGIFGFRAIEADPIKAMPFIVTDFNKQLNSARASFVADIARGGLVSSAEIIQQYVKAERVRFQAFKQMHNAFKAAEQLGAPRGKILKEMNRLTAKERGAVVSGRYLPYTPGPGVRQIFNTNFRELREETGRNIENPFINAFKEIMKIRKNNMSIDINDGDFDQSFSIPEEYYQKETLIEPGPYSSGTVTTAGLNPTPSNPVVVGGAGIIPKGSAAYNDILDISGIETEILNDS